MNYFIIVPATLDGNLLNGGCDGVLFAKFNSTCRQTTKGSGTKLLKSSAAGAHLIGYVSPTMGYCESILRINWYQEAAGGNFYEQGDTVRYNRLKQYGFLYAWEMPAADAKKPAPDPLCPKV
ncbi:unnamed protein product, partial [Mesorhabditis spiculigera]